MKYGLLVHGPTTNLGDDIQSYAISQFLPQIDYIIDREKINSFVSEDEEPVATVMSAWWMWHKWNWPPSKYIYPHFVGFHYSDNEKAKQAGCPVDYKYLSGVGADYLNAYGPIGCRDYFTKQKMEENGVKAEFSGCITLTLPQQKIIKPEKEYICLVDVTPKVEQKVREMLKDTDIEIKTVCHDIDQKANQQLSWEERSKNVEETLTLYQNAKCVLTRRLHCALPCLAMGVPTLLVIHTLESIRFIPYYDWLHCCKPEDFISGDYKYDLMNPPANKTEHMETRNALIKSVQDFVASAKDINATADELNRMPHSEKAIAKWRNKKMKETLVIWCKDTKKDLEQIHTLTEQYNTLKAKKNAGKEVKLRPVYKIDYELNPYKVFWHLLRKPIDVQNKELEKLMLTFLRGMRKNYKEIKYLQDGIKKLS